MSDDALEPNNLTCEHRRDPLGVDEPAPRLGWTLSSGRRGARQLAYQIVVATSRDDLSAATDVLWDTGRVQSDETVGIPYRGKPLQPGSRYHWKVRVWDENDTPSAYSEPAWWEMGLLGNAQWSGAWIGLNDVVPNYDVPPSAEEIIERNLQLKPSPFLRKAFQLDKPVAKARLYATAKGLYEVHLNGRRVGDHVLSPGWTDYDKRIQYQTFDVTDMLEPGANAVGAILGDGWYCGYVGFDQKRRGSHYGSAPQFLMQLDLTYADGARERIVTDGTWRSATGPLTYSDLLMGEWYDARNELGCWSEAGFDDAEWLPVSLHPQTDALLVAEPAPPVRVTREVRATKVTQPASGVYVFDLGQNIVGWARLTVSGPAGSRVVLRFAEMVTPDGGIYTENWRSAQPVDTYVLKGEGTEVYEPRFTFHGFRYVEVTGFPGEPPLEAIVGRVVHSDLPETGSFECSQPMVNQLQQNIMWTQRGNFLSVPTDCPQRDERLGWLGDAQIYIRTACFNMDVAAFFEKWMEDIADAQSPQGAFPDVAPRVTVLSDGAPAWGDAGIIVPWTIYQCYGDARIIERHYEAMARWLDYVLEANPNYIRSNRLGRNYGDWLAVDTNTPKDLLATAYFAYIARLMSNMAAAVGRHSDAARYSGLFESVKAAFNEAYVAPDARIRGETQTCYVLALRMDLLPEELRPLAARHLVDDIERRGGHLSTGFVGVGYLCPVLSDTGNDELAYRLLLNDSYPSWGYSIRHGATTIWERWDGWTEERGFQTPSMNSFNQYALGSIGEWLYRYVAGIDVDPERPGYKHILIRPRRSERFRHARAEYKSIRGTIISDWQAGDGSFQLRVKIPANTTATVYLPVPADYRVAESGRPVVDSVGIRVLRRDGEKLALFVPSGEYFFEATRATTPIRG